MASSSSATSIIAATVRADHKERLASTRKGSEEATETEDADEAETETEAEAEGREEGAASGCGGCGSDT